MDISRWFAALGLLLGASYAAFMGPLHVPDEGGHMYRAWLVSEGTCKALPAIGDPTVYGLQNRPDYSNLPRRVTWIELGRGATGRDLLNLRDDAHGNPLPVISMFYAVNLYSCLPYLPAGVAFRVGRLFTSSPLILMYVGRFANLIFYLAMVLFAMRLLPKFQLPLAILALMPMALHQAASLSADAVTMAVAIVLIAYILRLSAEPAPLRRSDYLLLSAGILAAGLCKSLAGLVFLVLLIPRERFTNRRTRWLALAGYVFLAFGTAALWQYVNRSNGEIFTTLKSAAGIQVSDNTAAILQQPAMFLGAVGRTLVSLRHEYLEEFIGKLAGLNIRLPGWIPWTYLALLFIAAGLGRAVTLSRAQRIVLIGTFLLNVGALFAVVWTTEVPYLALTTDMLAGRGWISGLQGRYLIPFAPLPLLAVSGLAPLGRRWIVAPALIFVTVANAVALSLVWDRFQKAPSQYEGQLVRSADDAKIYLVRNGEKHWIVDGHWITTHGYKWPEDIHVIAASTLAPMPEGAPVQ